MSRRMFLGRALALLGAPAVLTAVGCTSNAVEQPSRYSDRPPSGPEGVGGGRQKGGAAGKGDTNTQTDGP